MSQELLADLFDSKAEADGNIAALWKTDPKAYGADEETIGRQLRPG